MVSPSDKPANGIAPVATPTPSLTGAASGGDTLRSLAQLQFRVEQLQAEVERAQRLSLLGTMVGVIAHEFNNILTPVLSYCQLAKARPDDAALTAKALDRAAAGAEKAARIANAILELTRDERLAGTGKHSGLGEQPVACDIVRAIDEVLLSMAREPEKDGIAVSIEGSGKALAKIRPVALHHVLLNLVINARKAMSGGGRLTFRYHGPADGVPASSTWNTTTRVHDDAGLGEVEPGWIVLEVEDTGRGIPEDVLPRLFEPFATKAHEAGGEGQVPQPTAQKGTGLGLTISKRLIEEAGGSIAVASERDVGTRFTLKLRAA